MEYLGLILLCLLGTSQAFYPKRNCTVIRHSSFYQCGIPGRNPTENPAAKPFPVSDLNRCRDFALATGNRKYPRPSSFGFNKAKKTCSLYTSELEDLVKDKNSTTVFYEPGCFICDPPECPLPYGKNLLLNGNFELGEGDTAAPWLQQITKGGRHSSHAAVTPFEMVKTNGELLQRVPLCSDSTYKVVHYYKIDGKTDVFSQVYSGTGFHTPEQGYIGSLLGVWKNRDKWLRYEDLYVIPDRPIPPDNPLQLSILGGPTNKAKFLVDDIQLYAVDPKAVRTPLPGAKSELINGGFETGSLHPWKIEIDPDPEYGFPGSITVVSPGIKSRYGLAIKNPGKDRGYFYFHQKIPVKPYTHYVLSFDYKVTFKEQAPPSDFPLKLTVTTNAPQRYRSRVEELKVPGAGLFRQVYPLVVDGDELFIELSITMDNGMDFLFDNLELFEAHPGV